MRKLLICIPLFLLGCKNKPINGLVNFDVSENDEVIIAYYQNGIGSLYNLDIATGHCRPFMKGDKLYSYTAPCYSDDGKILFIKSVNEDKYKSFLCVADTAGRNIRQFSLSDSGIITAAIFGKNSSEIFYLKAGEYAAYSPLASRATHGFDLYKFSEPSGKSTRMTNVNAYSMSGLKMYGDSILLRIDGSPTGLYTVTADSGKLNRFAPENTGRRSVDLYYSADYSPQLGLMALEMPHEVYLLRLGDSIATLHYKLNTNILKLRFAPHGRQLLYMAQGREEDTLFRMDIDSRVVQPVAIKLPGIPK